MSDSSETEREPANSQATVGYFDEVASGWSQKYRESPHFKMRLHTVLDWIASYSTPLELLDYGCGSGVLLKALATAGHAVTGTDRSEGMLTAARQQIAGLPEVGRVRLLAVNEACDGAYQDRQYDGVISLGVLEYLPQPTQLLERLAAVLKPGGFLILSFPNRSSGLRWAERCIARYPGLFRRLGLFPHLTGKDSYLRYQTSQFTTAELSRALADHGFQLRRVRHHVAPRWLGVLANHSSIGMTTIAEWVKASR